MSRQLFLDAPRRWTQAPRIDAHRLAAETGARLVLPSQTLLEGMEYLPSFKHVQRTATVPYLAGHVGRVPSVQSSHSSARRHHE